MANVALRLPAKCLDEFVHRTFTKAVAVRAFAVAQVLEQRNFFAITIGAGHEGHGAPPANEMNSRSAAEVTQQKSSIYKITHRVTMAYRVLSQSLLQ